MRPPPAGCCIFTTTITTIVLFAPHSLPPFLPRHDLVISDSEDRAIRVWDVQKRMCIQTFRRESDRFWMLAVHPEQNLIAAGHDSGMVVFKLERERPAFAASNGQLFYVKDRYLRRCVLGTGADVPLASLRTRATGLGACE